MLTQAQQRFLLRIARESIRQEMAKRHRGGRWSTWQDRRGAWP